MINLKQFLLDSNIDFGTYALVFHDNKIEPVWFTKYDFKGEDWFLESPCELYKVMEVRDVSDANLIEYLKELLDKDANIEEYINEYVESMIVDGVLYEINNFQCSPYLPEYVDDIKLISERECLEYMLMNNKY